MTDAAPAGVWKYTLVGARVRIAEGTIPVGELVLEHFSGGNPYEQVAVPVGADIAAAFAQHLKDTSRTVRITFELEDA